MPSDAPIPSPRPRVLLVDDDELIRLALAHLLAPSHEVTLCEGAEQALEALSRGERYEALLCDLHMPGMDGLALYERIAADWPEMARRVIFLTGGAHSPRAMAFLEASPRPRLEKPFPFSALRALLDAPGA